MGTAVVIGAVALSARITLNAKAVLLRIVLSLLLSVLCGVDINDRNRSKALRKIHEILDVITKS